MCDRKQLDQLREALKLIEAIAVGTSQHITAIRKIVSASDYRSIRDDANDPRI